MKQQNNLESTQKRASLKRIRNVGLGAAAAASMGTSEWMRPVVQQVMLPAHAVTTELTLCSPPRISAARLPCSAGMPIEVTITASEGSPVRILETPTILATPTTTPNANGDWKTVTGDAAPAVITDTEPYNAVTRGQVMSEDQCFPPEAAIPATGVPNDPTQQPLTSLEFTYTYQCEGDGVDTTPQTVTVDLLVLSV